MFNFWTFFIRRKQFGVLIVVALTLFGLMSAFSIPKESSPEVVVPIAIVSTVMPGAVAIDVEKLITNVLEEPLSSNLKEVKKITSNSGDSASAIVVEFLASADMDQSMADLRDEVERAKVDLPEDAEDPSITQIDLTREPVITATISAALPTEILFRLAEEVQDELERLREVSTVDLSGVSDREVQVLVRREALARHNVDLLSVVGAIAAANAAIPAGSIVGNDIEFPVRFAGDITTPTELGSIVVALPGGYPVYLRDIAVIHNGRAKSSSIARTSIDGELAKSSISFNVFKSSNTDITDAAAAVRDKLESMQAKGEILEAAEVLVMFDRGELLWTDLSTLMRSGLQTTLLVIFVLAIAIGWRESLIAGLAIPLSFLVAFFALYYSGNTINFISLFALVLAVGIIVDSAIVITEAINLRLKAGTNGEVDKEEAALGAVREFNIPLLAGTATTIAVFAPLLLVSGIVGEFIKGIPFTIIFILLASLFVALAVVPLVAVKFLHRSHYKGKFAEARRKFIEQSRIVYKQYLDGFLSKKKNSTILLWTLSLLFIFTLALPSLGAIKVIFFGSGNSEYVFIDIEMPHGTVLAGTDMETRRVEQVLYEMPEIESFVTSVGGLSPFTQLASSVSGGEKYANIFITLKSEYVEESSSIVDKMREKLSDIDSSLITVDQLSEGPPSVAPIVITYLGEDFAELDEAVDKTATLLRSIEGATDIKSSTRNNGAGYVLRVEKDKAAALGVSVVAAGRNLRTALYGEKATTIKENGLDIDVRVLLDLNTTSTEPLKNNETTLTELVQVPVATPQGLIPLSSFVSSGVEESRAAITHEDGLRSATVMGNLTTEGNLREVIKEFQKRKHELNLASNIDLRIGGEDEDFNKSFQDMFVALIIGMVSMFAILILQFNSVRYALYILLSVPLSLIGVFAGLMLVGEPVSFPSLMGFIALAGIVVNNAIIMIDTINRERRENGGNVKRAVVDGAVARLRPVILTAVTTVIGIIPLTFAASIWIPLAYSIIFGLSFSTIITLVLIPTLYYRWPGKMI